MTRLNARAGAEGRDVQMSAWRRIAWRRRMLGVLVVFSACSIWLMALAPIQPVAFAPGEVRTAAETVVLKTPTGGAVARLLVEPGSHVRAGDPILRFDDAETVAEIMRLASKKAHLTLSRDRYAALIEKRAFEPQPRSLVDATHLDEARRQALAEQDEFLHEAARFDAQIAEEAAELASVSDALENTRRLLDAQNEQLAIAEQLAQQRNGTRNRALEARARVADTQSRIAEQEGRRNAAASAVRRLESERREASSRREAKWSDELTAVSRQIADIDAQLEDVTKRYRRLLIASPIDGQILELGASAAGDAISPNSLIASIVPTNPSGEVALLAKIRIAPADVGYVQAGSPVAIDVSAFDVEVFGEVTGQLLSISPGTLIGDDGAPYFRGEVSLDRTTKTLNGSLLRITPGMTVNAKIATGENTLLGYLAKPVLRAFDGALRER